MAIHWECLAVSLLRLLQSVGSAPVSVKGTSVARFDVMSMFAGSWFRAADVKDPEKELVHMLGAS